MERIVRAGRQIGVNRNQILNGRNLGGNNNLIAPKAKLFCAGGREKTGLDDGFVHHSARRLRLFRSRVLIHQVGEKVLVERAPIHPHPHRLVVFEGHLNHLAKLQVFLVLKPHIARVDAIFRQGLRTGWMIVQQLVADIVKIPHQGHIKPHFQKLFVNMGHSGRRLIPINRDPHQLRPCAGQLCHLFNCCLNIRRVRVGHGLHHHRRIAPHNHPAHIHRHRFAARHQLRQVGHNGTFQKLRLYMGAI